MHPVWGLNLLLIATAVALYAGPVHGLQPLAHPHLPWWSIAIAIAERCVVHLHFRRGAHSFSLGDIPLVVGLISCSAEAFVIGCLLGGAIVMLFDGRLPPVKFVFNISQFAHACGRDPGYPRAAPVSDHVGLRTWVVTLSSVSLGLCGAVIASSDARALPLLAVPSLTLFAAYRTYLHAVSLNTTATPQSLPYGHLQFPDDRPGCLLGVAVVDTGVDGAPPDVASKDHSNSRVVESAVANTGATGATDSYSSRWRISHSSISGSSTCHWIRRPRSHTRPTRSTPRSKARGCTASSWSQPPAIAAALRTRSSTRQPTIPT
jgi:hypothetical protein